MPIHDVLVTFPQAVGTLTAFSGATATVTVNFPASVGNPGQLVAGKFTGHIVSGYIQHHSEDRAA